MKESPDEVVVNHLKTIRRNRKISQETLARKADITLWTYRRIENWQAEPSSLTLMRIARALKTKPDMIFFIITKESIGDYRKKLKIKTYRNAKVK